MANKTLQLKRQVITGNASDAKNALETAFTGSTFAEGEPALVLYTDSEGSESGVVLGIKGGTGFGSVFYNAATVDKLLEAIENKIGVLANLTTTAKSNIVAAINELDGEIGDLSGLTTTNKSTIVAAINELNIAAATYTVSATTEDLPANVAVRYNLKQTVNGSETTVGANIDIPKDSSLVNVYLGHVDDKLTDEDETTHESPTTGVTSGTGSEALCFINQLANGKYKLSAVDCESFLQEEEFSEGLQVVDHVVSVKKDSSSENFLSVSSNGVKISGVQDAIDAAQASATTVVAEGTDAGNNLSIVETAGTDGHKIFTVNLTDVASASGLTAEIAARKAVTGVQADTYSAPAGSSIVSGATNMNAAIGELDTAVKGLKDAKVSVVKAQDSENFLDVTESQDKTTYTIKIDGVQDAIDDAIESLNVAQVGAAGQFLYAISEADGKISASAATLNASAVSASPIEGDTFEVTGTNVQAQMAEVVAEISDMQDGAYSGVTSANAAINAGSVTNNGQELTFQLDTTTATNNITSDMLDITSNGLRMKDTFDCGTWS